MDKLRGWVNRHKHKIIITLTIGLILSVGYMLTDNGFLKENSDKLKYYGFSVTILTLIIAIIQAARNHDWNRRITATTALLEVKDKLGLYSATLHKHFGTLSRDEHDTIKIDDIHEKICLKNSKGEYHQDPTTKRHKLDNTKEDIYKAIRETLNLYEYIAMGVYQGVFDKEIVADLMASNVIRVSSHFSEYIIHVNNMHGIRQGQTWINIKTLGAEFKKKYRSEKTVKARSNV